MRPIAACENARFRSISHSRPCDSSDPLTDVRSSPSAILALDPGLANFGAVILDRRGSIIAADVLATVGAESVKSKAARARATAAGRKAPRRELAGGAAVDHDRRTLEVATWLRAFARSMITARPAVVVAEATGGSKGARAAIATATANTIAAIVAAELGIPLVRVHVQAWRRTLVPGKRAIPDAELYAAIGVPASLQVGAELRARGRKASAAVHALDAVGMGRWALDFSAVARRTLGLGGEGGL